MWQWTLNSQLLQGQNRRSMLHLPGIYMQALRIRSGQRKQNFTDKTTCNFRLKTQHEESLLLSQKPFSGLTKEYQIRSHVETFRSVELLWSSNLDKKVIFQMASKWHRIEVLPFAMAILPEFQPSNLPSLAECQAKSKVRNTITTSERRSKPKESCDSCDSVIQYDVTFFPKKKNTNQLSNSIQFIWHAWKKSKKNLTSSPVKKKHFKHSALKFCFVREKSLHLLWCHRITCTKKHQPILGSTPLRSTNFGLDPSRTLEVPLTSASTWFKRFTCRFGANVDVDFFSLFSTNPPF